MDIIIRCSALIAIILVCIQFSLQTQSIPKAQKIRKCFICLTKKKYQVLIKVRDFSVNLKAMPKK